MPAVSFFFESAKDRTDACANAAKIIASPGFRCGYCAAVSVKIARSALVRFDGGVKCARGTGRSATTFALDDFRPRCIVFHRCFHEKNKPLFTVCRSGTAPRSVRHPFLRSPRAPFKSNGSPLLLMKSPAERVNSKRSELTMIGKEFTIIVMSAHIYSHNKGCSKRSATSRSVQARRNCAKGLFLLRACAAALHDGLAIGTTSASCSGGHFVGKHHPPRRLRGNALPVVARPYASHAARAASSLTSMRAVTAL